MCSLLALCAISFAVADDLVDQGWNQIHKGELVLALATFTEEIRRDPKDAQAYDGRAAVWYLLRRPNDALKDLDEAIRLDDRVARYHSGRGSMLGNLLRFDEAIRACDRAIELDPNLAVAYKNRAMALACLGRYDRALRDATKSFELEPNNSELRIVRAKILIYAKRFKEAQTDCEAALRDSQQYDKEAHLTRIDAYLHAGESAKAVELCQLELRREPVAYEFYQRLMWIYGLPEENPPLDLKKSIESGEKARALGGDKDPTLLWQLGRLYARTGRYATAVELLGRAAAGFDESDQVNRRNIGKDLEEYKKQLEGDGADKRSAK